MPPSFGKYGKSPRSHRKSGSAEKLMTVLKYGKTNTFYLPGNGGGLLVDTDYAGTLPAFYKAIKANAIRVSDILYVMATHYHPDHAGLIGELTEQGVKLLLLSTQTGSVHFADGIFARDRLPYTPINEAAAKTVSCEESRAFLRGMGIGGEIVSTPSHSKDSVSLLLDSGDCIVGDLEPIGYLSAYGGNPALAEDWERILEAKPKRIFYGHANPGSVERA